MKNIILSLFIVFVYFSCFTTSSSPFNKNVVIVSSLGMQATYDTQILVINPWDSNKIVSNTSLNTNITIIGDVVSYDQNSNTVLVIGFCQDGLTCLVEIDIESKAATQLGSGVKSTVGFSNWEQRYIYVDSLKTAFMPAYEYSQQNNNNNLNVPILLGYNFATGSLEITRLPIPNYLGSNGVMIQGYDPNINEVYGIYQTDFTSINLMSYQISNPQETFQFVNTIQDVNTTVDMVFVDNFGDVYIMYDNSTSSYNPFNFGTPLKLTICKIVLQPGNEASCFEQFSTVITHSNKVDGYYSPFILSQDNTQLLFISNGVGGDSSSSKTFEFVSINSGFTQIQKVEIPNLSIQFYQSTSPIFSF